MAMAAILSPTGKAAAWFHVANNGKPTRLLPLAKGSADLGVGPEGIIMIPMMMVGTVVGYKVDTR
jgi:hypothetical protein